MSTPLGRVLMVQGTASHAGKSAIVTAFCRVFARAGLRVAPFKAQNMSNNAAVVDGGEIGRAQAVQARAAGIEPTVDMNPVLLKPQGDRTSQVVVQGRPWRTTDAVGYYSHKRELWPVVTGALDRLRATHDVVVIEGAGSPAEINLAQYDIVNMRVARHADAPVLLVGDIDRGGVFAALYGTVALLTPEERAYVRGFIINKFRGDPSLLTPGFSMLQERTRIPTLGILPYLDLGGLPSEDGLELDARGRFAHANRDRAADAVLDIVVIRLPRIANLDEFQPLAREPGVEVRFVRDAERFGNPDLVIVPGTKATMADLAWMRERGLDACVRDARDTGTPVLGVCGGYQMLGEHLADPGGVESAASAMPGLGLLPMETIFAADKVTERVRAKPAAASGLWSEEGCDTIDAYEIHIGRTLPADASSLGPAPFALETRDGSTVSDGAMSVDRLVVGTYLHGLFENGGFRRGVLRAVAQRKRVTLPAAGDDAVHDRAVDAAFDALADAVCTNLDMTAINALVGIAETMHVG
ncbi:MAG TPA: cobyric acid synthase [Gemmatimonadaceae bacterium]